MMAILFRFSISSITNLRTKSNLFLWKIRLDTTPCNGDLGKERQNITKSHSSITLIMLID